ncbi:peptidase domain-containing ABC transporter [Archangium lansingense]|uniref:Peptidase domain-containing ABC transporter n=1 Tax=Archangium lansingense TaxID=2995310 RepID=A0ABT4A808_9BACT|nr:peptidase domain-containing ABC transporter [Archangium lansinium]MCY1077789.1 peptidase domain-containing ABC transporter [Archangium lansinium]
MADEPKQGLLDRFPVLRSLQERAQRRHRVPDVRQLSMTDCGPACLAMVLGYHGRELSLEQVRELAGTTRDGTTAQTLLAAGRKLGLRGQGVSLDMDALPYLPPASILHWNFNHYVVFERLGPDCVHLVDPGQGRRQVSLEQFRKSFTGVALLFEPTEDFHHLTSRRSGAFRYLLPLVRQSDTLGRIVVTSAALQLFSLAVPLVTGMVVDRVVPRGDYHLLVVLSVALASLAVFQFLASLIRGHLLLELRTRLDASMTLGFLEHLVRLPYSFFQLRPAGDLLTRMSMQATVRETLSTSAISTLLDGTLVLFYLVLLLFTNAWMGLVVLALCGVQVLVLLFSAWQRRHLLSQNLELDAKNQSYSIAMLTGMQTLKAFGAEQRVVQDYASLFVNVLNVGLARGRMTLWVDSLTSMVKLASPLVLLAMGAYQVMQGKLTLGEMLALNAMASALLVPLSSLVGTAGNLQLLGSYLERLNDVLDATPERPMDRPGKEVRLQGAIELENVSFRFGSDSPLVVRDVSVRIQPGQLVALVGRSGAGKSTLANLLLGLYLPTSGRVSYDGVDLGELDLQSVRGQMGVVPQNPSFFGSTLREAIALGRPDLPLERVMEASRLAQIHDDIMAMPLQYDTPMGDQGLMLSGGQRQRMALARALAHEPAVLLLDEATSALDAITESHVHQALASLHCTRVIIAHRLSTVRSADVILVMEAGQVVEMGRHEELLALQGHYARLVRAQMEPARPTSLAG